MEKVTGFRLKAGMTAQGRNDGSEKKGTEFIFEAATNARIF
jgi:hypothetical protein